MKINWINFPVFADQNGALSVFEQGSGPGKVEFPVIRSFSVVANAGSHRGNHAHHQCSQLLVCLNGKIQLDIFDGIDRESVLIVPDGRGVLITPKTWVSQEYLKDNSVLLVLCDRPYEAEDYITDLDLFVNLVGKKE